MAANFVVEDGTSKTDANAYATIAQVDQHNDDFVADTSWDAATDVAKQAAIREATIYLDSRFNTRWRGLRTDEDQSLDWPRSWIEDFDGFAIESDEMPTALIQATAELAIKVEGGEDLMADLSDPGTIKRKKTKVGPIEVDTTYMDGNPQFKKYRKVDALLRDLVVTLGEIRRS